jgi:thymidylate synthase
MLFKAATLDDTLGNIIRRLLKSGEPILPRKGRAREFTSVLVELSDPRARFSRTEGRGALISFLGETLWYLSASDRLKHIEHYIPKYRTFIKASPRAVRAPGAYGPRLFGGEHSQMTKLLAMLKQKQDNSDTRQAVAQIFDRSDLKPDNGDVPCTTTLQFLPRKGKLHLATTMRSNDVYRGFPGDVFAFTFIQELVARTLGLELGTYSHFVGSLHLYDTDEARARDYLNEGFQTPVGMPSMPEGDPWPSVKWLLEAEMAIRCGLQEPPASGIDHYWLDLARLLRIKVLYDKRDMRQLVQVKNEMVSPTYNAFIRGRQVALQRSLEAQLGLPGIPTAG